MSFDEAKVILEYYEKSKADKIENDKKDKKLNDDITIKTGPFGLYLKLTNNTNVKLPKKYKDNIDSLTLEEALVIIENDKTKPKSGRGKSAPKAKVKGKPKVADKTTKPKEVKEKVKKETKPKEKVPKPIKMKQIKTKF
jgi:hypothetical protein